MQSLCMASLNLEYPWRDWDTELKVWLYLPDVINPPLASRLIRTNSFHCIQFHKLSKSESFTNLLPFSADFILLLFACQQRLVFIKEHHATTPEDLPGGTNDEVMEVSLTPNVNPTPDFLTSSR